MKYKPYGSNSFGRHGTSPFLCSPAVNLSPAQWFTMNNNKVIKNSALATAALLLLFKDTFSKIYFCRFLLVELPCLYCFHLATGLPYAPVPLHTSTTSPSLILGEALLSHSQHSSSSDSFLARGHGQPTQFTQFML